MVKAYLKYVQHDVIGGVVGNEANLETCQITKYDGTEVIPCIVTGCNEVVNFTNSKTGEVEYKIYDKDA